MIILNPDLQAQLAEGIYDQSWGIVPEKNPGNSGPITESRLGELASVCLGCGYDSRLLPNAGSIGKPDFPLSDSYYFLKSLNREGITLPGQSPDSTYNVQAIRNDFPILRQKVNGRPLIWFDNAATTQKPQAVIEALEKFYRESNSNVHRGAHSLAAKATDAYETAREKVQHFLGASSAAEIIFLRGTTEAINLVAQTYGRAVVGKGDQILLTTMEHHSNIVPWQMLRDATGANIEVIPITEWGEVNLDEYGKLLEKRPRIVAITHVSNVLGTINPVREMIEMAHRYGACVLVDGAQAVAHLPVDVRELDVDFYTFSGHKIYGPTGIGVLYGKKSLLEAMPPWQGGGSMIDQVTFAETTYNRLPYKFEAGTGNIADAVGLGAAIDYLQKIGHSEIERYEKEITGYAMAELAKIRGVHLIGTSRFKTSVLSFLVDGISLKELGETLDREGIATRAGHHCAQPLMRHYGIEGTIRASLGIYNTKEEIDVLVETIKTALQGAF
ncbi:MAG: SufS family cysteine desulfurase [Bacteroidota bacterium]